MTSPSRSLGDVVAGLRAEGLLTEEDVAPALPVVERLGAAQPWYVRAMVGVGAWLASLLLIGFVAGLGLAIGGSTVVGLLLIAAATWGRRQPAAGGNDFALQCLLATSLAGQALLCWGLADLLPGDDVKTACVILLAMSAVLFVVFPDRIHRVLMVLFGIGALVMLCYAFGMNAAVPIVGPLLATALVALYRRRAVLTASGHGGIVRPLSTGLMLSSFGCLMLSAIYVLPELDSDFAFYPRPWISTLLLGALFIYVGSVTLPASTGGAQRASVPLRLPLQLLMVAIVAAAWAAPGLLLALVVALLGASAGHRTFAGAGLAFLVVFIAAYFYGIEITLLEKSLTLVSAGIVILLARALLPGLPGRARHG